MFKGYYQRKDDPSRPQFYRHAALRAQFSRIGDEWFCEILPDYFYTDDGYREFRFADRSLAKMKRIEKNGARLGRRCFGAASSSARRPRTSFYEPPEHLLDFGPPVRSTSIAASPTSLAAHPRQRWRTRPSCRRGGDAELRRSGGPDGMLRLNRTTLRRPNQ